MKVIMRTGNESLVSMLAERGLNIFYDHLCRRRSVITLWEQIVDVVPAECFTNTTNRFPSDKLSQIHTSLMFLSELV